MLPGWSLGPLASRAPLSDVCWAWTGRLSSRSRPARLSVSRFDIPSCAGAPTSSWSPPVSPFWRRGLAELAARWAGSATLDLAMIASVLLLVPGIPALDAQNDILDGHSTLGTARAVVVGMILIFIATGVWIARAVLAVPQ